MGEYHRHYILYNTDLIQSKILIIKERRVHQTGADPGIYFGGQTKDPNRKLRAKPESRARSARVSRATSRGREAPEN